MGLINGTCQASHSKVMQAYHEEMLLEMKDVSCFLGKSLDFSHFYFSFSESSHIDDRIDRCFKYGSLNSFRVLKGCIGFLRSLLLKSSSNKLFFDLYMISY